MSRSRVTRPLLLATIVATGVCVGCASLEGASAYRSGTDALDRGDSATAIQRLERAASLVPESSEVHNHLGLAYAQAGRLGDAIREFESATQLDCDNRSAIVNLALAREQQRRQASHGGAAGGER